MPQSRPKKYQIEQRSQNLGLWRTIAGIFFLTAVILSGFYITYTAWRQHIERGQYNISDTYVGEDLFHSLDLKLASKASFPSGPIAVTKDLGYIDELHEQIFQFSVPDDSLTEYGLMLTPSTPKPPNGYPVLILLHGYFNAERYNTTRAYLGDAEFYARQGFLVLEPDLRGQGYSISSGTADSAYYSMAYNTDVLSLISAVKKTQYLDKRNISLWGHSMGGYLALRAAVISKDIKNVIVLSGPVDSLSEMYLTYIAPSDEDNPYALATRNDVFSKYGTPTDASRFWYDASPINLVSQINAHLQIYVGLQDGTVPPVFSADLDAALTKAHINHQYFVYPDGNHGLIPQREQIYSESLKLMKPSQAGSQA
jgi:dipeptidyl aminopeptidase/acylaminoacyl peptidase